MTKLVRSQAKIDGLKVQPRKFEVPVDGAGRPLKVSDYYGINVFDFHKSEILTKEEKQTLSKIIESNGKLTKEIADKYANAVLTWALSRGATHFTHWFQPLTGTTAEKHDAFLSLDKEGRPLEKLSASQLIQGEPDASSFPNGGSRSTFEARGYTSWDLTSPIFLKTHENGKTLCIPTAFVSYFGDALDIKTPLLRSISQLSKAATEFINLTSVEDSEKVTGVEATAGCEQEYFLIDKALYFERPDLVMSGRTLFGAVTSRNQQLEDHYFGTVPERVLAFMQEVEVELYRLGVPAKTRHNEVAPGQYELAPIFTKANVAVDQNQIIMSVLQTVANRHDMVCLLHEKPFLGVNGSGKHLNWSMSDSKGRNLLEPTDNPHTNYRFLATVAIICEAVKRHSELLRSAIASHGNDHRLGANEAPPSIISIFLGDTLTKILEAYAAGKEYEGADLSHMDLGADQLANLKKDNTDRNRTSPFAFTGNKFEFRAVGSAANVGIPLTVLNAAVTDVLVEVNSEIKTSIESGKSIDEVLKGLIVKYYNQASAVVFNGDGYSDDWTKEAEKRGLPNLRTSAEALMVIQEKGKTDFLVRNKVFTQTELDTRFNVRVERYIKHREIEFRSLISLVNKEVNPAVVAQKELLASSIMSQKEIGMAATVETELLKRVDALHVKLHDLVGKLDKSLENYQTLDEEKLISQAAHHDLKISEEIADVVAKLEESISDDLWGIPNYFDLMFIK